MDCILPNSPLNAGPISRLFKDVGLTDFHQACDYIWKLPYGRTQQPGDFQSVLSEGQGTCSSKHGLLKQLSDELDLAIELVVGIYAMNEANTPGVGGVLSKTSFSSIPEAHCYLKCNNAPVDLTRFPNTPIPLADFYQEHNLTAQQLADRKNQLHLDFLKAMFGDQAKEVWAIREQCIAALAANTLSSIDNFNQTNKLVTTSGTVPEAQLKQLGGLGYKAVINLLPPSHTLAIPNEQQLVEAQGLAYMSIAVDFAKPTLEDFEQFAHAVTAHAHHRTHIHCAANYRASAFYAVYAVRQGVWTFEQAQGFILSIWPIDEYPQWVDFVNQVVAQDAAWLQSVYS